MRITEKQLIFMFKVLEGSLAIADRTDFDVFGFNNETRLKIYNQIINQQSDELITVGEINKTELHL